MDKNAELFIRKHDGVYVIPYPFTTAGVQLASEPFEYLSFPVSTEWVWAAVTRALQNSDRVLPHPKTWDDEKAWYRKAGARNWREFVVKAKTIVSVRETEDQYIFKKHRYNRGAVVSDKDTSTAVSKNASLEDIAATLKKYI